MSDYMILRHDVSRPLPIADGSVHCVVTSPPYWGLRDYGDPRQIGLEPTPQEYVDTMVRVFREVRRVLRDDGTCWLNLGDSYVSGPSGRTDDAHAKSTITGGLRNPRAARMASKNRSTAELPGLKIKDLVGIPWRVALALQADGWYLRSDVVWAKLNPMPESVTDRPTKAHEYVFLLTKNDRYYYDNDAVKEKMAAASKRRYDYAFGGAKSEALTEADRLGIGVRTRWIGSRKTDGARNLRTVWAIATQPYAGAHFAVMPSALAERCVKAGSPVGGIVFDPFSGAGTTGVVALSLGRSYLGCEVNHEYAVQSRRRIDRPHAAMERPERKTETMPLFARTS